MQFLFENSRTRLKINFSATESALKDLIEEGYLDEDFDLDAFYNDEMDDLEATVELQDAVQGYLDDFVENKEEAGSDEYFLDETDGLIKYAYVIDENTYFNQFLSAVLY